MPLGRRSLEDGSVKTTDSSSMTSSPSFFQQTQNMDSFQFVLLFLFVLFLSVLVLFAIAVFFLLFVVFLSLSF